MKKLFLTLFLLSGISMTKAQMRFGTGDVLPMALAKVY
jgi:hypothetical protein